MHAKCNEKKSFFRKNFWPFSMKKLSIKQQTVFIVRSEKEAD